MKALALFDLFCCVVDDKKGVSRSKLKTYLACLFVFEVCARYVFEVCIRYLEEMRRSHPFVCRGPTDLK